MSYRYWSKEEVTYLRKHYGRKHVADMTTQLGRSVRAIEKKAAKLGLVSKRKGSPVYIMGADRSRKPRKIIYGADHPAWRPPLVPWQNKGRMYIKRTASGDPEFYSRYLIETMRGIELAPDQVVFHRDGNPLNCELSNLEVISRAELACRNSIYRYPAEVVQVIRTITKLKKAIYHAEEQTK